MEHNKEPALYERKVCPNCDQWQDEDSGDCFNQCAKRGFAKISKG